MANRCFRSTCTAIILLLYSGCATNWSDADKAKLSSIAINKVTVAKDAYKKPDAKESPGMANSIPMVTGGGLIPSLIGSAIDASVTAKQQKKFEAADAQYFDGLATEMAIPPTTELGAALKQALGRHEFFGPRMAESAPTVIAVEILSYGLQISPASPKDHVRLRVRIIARASLKLPDDRIFWNAQLTGVASTSAFAKDILADPNFMPGDVKEAADDFCRRVIAELNQKITPRK